MAEENKQTPPVVKEVAVVAPVSEPVAAPVVVEKPAPEPVKEVASAVIEPVKEVASAVIEPVKEAVSAVVEPVKEAVAAVTEAEVAEKAVEVVEEGGDNKVGESASFKEESNIVADLPNPQQKALDELKELVKLALEKHEFTAPPPPVKEVVEEKEAEVPVEEKKESVEVPVKEEEAPKAEVEKVVEEKSTPPPTEAEKVVVEAKVEEKAATPPLVKEEPPKATIPPPAEVEKVVEAKVEEKAATPSAEVVVEKIEQKVEAIVEKIAQKVEAVEEIKETIVETTTPPPAPEAETPEPVAETEVAPPPPPSPEEVSIWGIKLLEDDKSDAILLKFLRARDFKVKEAFSMLKSVVQWRKEFGIDTLVEEETSTEGLEKVVYLHGVDKEGHAVMYNSFGEFQDKEFYQNTFADAEKRTKFLRGIIQFFEKTIRNLDFTPDGICTLFQVIDLKNSPGLFFFKKDLRQAISHALQLFQDNYPEFVAKQVYINVPWWFRAYYSMINAIFSPRTKSKFVFAGPSRSAEILFKYIAPEKVPVRYGGLSKEGESEFTCDDAATEVIIKPASKHTIEFEVTEKCTLAWELRVVGWDVSYGAEFVPSAEDGYTVILQKTRKVGPTDEAIISSSYSTGEPGKVVLTINNQSSKRKNLVYRSKNKPSD